MFRARFSISQYVGDMSPTYCYRPAGDTKAVHNIDVANIGDIGDGVSPTYLE